MSNFESEDPAEGDWEERGELAWNEFDWERYLREQDETIHRYLGFYESLKDHPTRIDEVAVRMGWGAENDEESDDAETSEEEESEEDVYTLHKNPIFVATKALYLSAKRHWQLIAGDSNKVPQSLAIELLSSLHTGEEYAVQAVHALDFGDYAMAISLFKRALASLNVTLAQVSGDAVGRSRALAEYRAVVLPQLFDLREIWLRVTAECRDELNRTVDGES